MKRNYIMAKEIQAENKSKRFDKAALLIALCWLVYTCSYLGKLGYNANIAKIEEVYSISHSTAGIVSTFFFFAYGIGQIFNGAFCRKYNIRLVVVVSLFVSGLMNILVAVSKDFTYVKYLWLTNGVALSILWPSLIRLLSETLDSSNIERSVFAMGTTVVSGTLMVYGLSALFVAWFSYTVMFFVAGILLPSIAVIWFFAYPRLTEKPDGQGESEPRDVAVKSRRSSIFWISVCALAFFAVVDNLVKDGLITWVPMILKEIYALPDYVSILLTTVLPILAIFGTSVAIALHKKIKDFVYLSAVLFFVSALLILLVIICLPLGSVVITLISLGLISCLMSGVNNIITSMTPLYWKDTVNSGMLAGVLNGFCYLGSTISAYGLGLVADNGGWTSVFILLLSLCILAVLLALGYSVTLRLGKADSQNKRA